MKIDSKRNTFFSSFYGLYIERSAKVCFRLCVHCWSRLPFVWWNAVYTLWSKLHNHKAVIYIGTIEHLLWSYNCNLHQKYQLMKYVVRSIFCDLFKALVHLKVCKDVGQSCQTVWCLFCVIVYTCWDNKTRAMNVWHMYLCALPHPQLGIWLQVNNSMVDRQCSLSFSANLMVHINLCVWIRN